MLLVAIFRINSENLTFSTDTLSWFSHWMQLCRIPYISQGTTFCHCIDSQTSIDGNFLSHIKMAFAISSICLSTNTLNSIFSSRTLILLRRGRLYSIEAQMPKLV